MNLASSSIFLAVLLCASVPSVLSADGSCEITCDNSDLCLGAGIGNDPPVCLREMESNLKSALAMVDRLQQEVNATRAEFDAFKAQQAVCGVYHDLFSCILGHKPDARRQDCKSGGSTCSNLDRHHHHNNNNDNSSSSNNDNKNNNRVV